MTVAFLSYADHYEEWQAMRGRPGINFIDHDDFSVARVEGDVAAAHAVGAKPGWRVCALRVRVPHSEVVGAGLGEGDAAAARCHRR